jgi:2',3'-cyclic-nucleotide 2'-phosphodiesterase
MIVIFIGDIVGAEATELVARNMPKLRHNHDVDLVIANAENSAPNGLGTTVKQLESLLEAGVDVLSGGNHSWDSAQAVASLKLPKVLRPANVAADLPGRGVLTVEAAGEAVTVVNLADGCALHSVNAATGKIIPAYQAWEQVEKSGTVIVDYHGDHVLEKQVFAHAVDGIAAAVFGSHTHEPTMPLHLLPGGTAFIADVGMTGPVGGVQGFDPGPLVRNLRERGDAFNGPLPGPLREVPITFGAVLVTIEAGKATKVERLTDASLTG